MASPDRRPITLERLVDETNTVYSLPLFYEKLSETINHPRSSVADIARIITEDQGLTARLLRLANSPMFGYHARVDSITKAVTRTVARKNRLPRNIIRRSKSLPRRNPRPSRT